MSLGLLDRHTKIGGHTTTFVPGVGTQQLPGGLYALSSNIGDYSSAAFAAVPEMDVYVGYSICQNLRFLVGYSLICIPNVQRAGEQIDPVIKTRNSCHRSTPPGQLGRKCRPIFPNHDSVFLGPGAESLA